MAPSIETRLGGEIPDDNAAYNGEVYVAPDPRIVCTLVRGI